MTEAPPHVRRTVKRVGPAIKAPGPKEPPPPKDTPPPEPSIPQERVGRIGKWVTRQYRNIGKLVSITDPVCGNAITMAAEAAGPAWERLAREHKVVRDVFNWLMQTSAATDVFLANLPIIITILAHHVPSFREFVGRSSMSFLAEFGKMEGTEAA